MAMSGTRAHMAILVLGIVGLGIMGFMMKVALESSPGVVAQGKVKVALAEEFSPRGLREVSVRNLPQGRGYEVRAVFGDVERGDAGALCRDLARSFVERFKGRRRNTVRVELHERGGWGCAGPELVHGEDFSIPKLLREIQIDHALEALRGAVHEASGIRVTGARRQEDCAVVEAVVATVVDAAAPPPAAGADPGATSGAGDANENGRLREAARELLVERLRGVPVRQVDVVLRSAGEEPVEIERMTLDARSLQARPVHRGLPRVERPGAYASPGAKDDETGARGE
jgi:hypothetical protein